MENSNYLTIADIHKAYGRTDILKGVSLQIPPGTFFTLLGPSGSGKTTLLNLLAGFDQCSTGSIRLGSKDITHLPPEKRNFGMVFQGYALFPHMSVAGNIAYPLKIRRWERARIRTRVEEMLALVDLTGLGHRMISQLSGGQMQRVALARSLVFEPSVILLDEPMSALDRKLRADLQFELRRIHAELGTTFILVTHDQDEAMTLSDRIAVINEGRIVQVGSPKELYETPSSTFVAEFLGKGNLIDGRLLAGGSSTLGEGQNAKVFVRPENIRMAAQLEQGEGDSASAIAGKVVDHAYYGDRILYKVGIPNAGNIIAYVGTRSDFQPQVGEAVFVSWAKDNAIHLLS